VIGARHRLQFCNIAMRASHSGVRSVAIRKRPNDWSGRTIQEATVKMRGSFFAFALALAGGAQAQSEQELQRQLAQWQKAIHDLQNRVNTLEAQKQAEPAAAPAASATAAAEPPVLARDSAAQTGAADPNKARLEISCMVQLDLINDFKPVDPKSDRLLGVVPRVSPFWAASVALRRDCLLTGARSRCDPRGREHEAELSGAVIVFIAT